MPRIIADRLKRWEPRRCAFLVDLITVKKLSRTAMVQAFCALKFFYVHVLSRSFELDRLHFPRRRRKLPVVLNQFEVRRLLEAAETLQQQAILMTLYSSGLRLSELIHLRVKDIDSTKMVIRVCHGKGGKDRNVLLSPTLLEILRRYFRTYRPQTWLFYGRTPDQPILDQTVQRMMRRLCDRAGLRQGVTVHTLRHYAESQIMPSPPGPFAVSH